MEKRKNNVTTRRAGVKDARNGLEVNSVKL